VQNQKHVFINDLISEKKSLLIKNPATLSHFFSQKSTMFFIPKTKNNRFLHKIERFLDSKSAQGWRNDTSQKKKKFWYVKAKSMMICDA